VKAVRSAVLFSFSILISVAASIGGIQSRMAFWVCIGLAGVSGIVGILTLDPVWKRIARLGKSSNRPPENTFTWRGQLRHRCPYCPYDTYDLAIFREHVRCNHADKPPLE